MIIDLTEEEINVIRTSLKYSKDRIVNAEATPNAVRQENIKYIEDMLLKLSKSN